MAKNRCGYTLLEAIVVIAIVSILLSFGVYSFLKERQRVENKGCLSRLYQTLKGLQLEAMREKQDFTLNVNGSILSVSGAKSSKYIFAECNFSNANFSVNKFGVFSPTPVVIKNLNAPAEEPDNLTITPVLIFSP
jgi:prepilin-type N-terminal cleavage/methylation domain-containing protein